MNYVKYRVCIKFKNVEQIKMESHLAGRKLSKI